MPATSKTSSLSSIKLSTTSLKYAGVSTTTNEQNERSRAMMWLIWSAPTWSAKAGSSGAGSTNKPDGRWTANRLFKKSASRRSYEPTASTMVCWGASFNITAMSPNCKSASTNATGPSERCASMTPRLVANMDLPAPPLVEKTVMTRPPPDGSPSPSMPTMGAGRTPEPESV